MDIMLHLGAHRCASTTFQSYLWENRVRLSKRGLTCWTPKRTRDGLLRGMLRHPARISIEDERDAIRSVGRLRVEFDRLRLSGQDGLLISEQNLLGSIRTNLAEMRLYPLLAERLMRFRPAFEGRRLRIGVCIRNYDDYWASSLADLIACGGAIPSVDQLDVLTTLPRRWRHVVRDIAVAFPDANVLVWPFERLAGQPNRQLQILWGGDCDRLEDSHFWRHRSADLRQLDKIVKLSGEPLIQGGPVEAGPRWMPFDEDQRSVLRAEYRRDLAWLTAGADGLARYVDGRPGSINTSGDGRQSRVSDQTSGQPTPASRPVRADVTRASVQDAVLFGGRYNGIEEGLGRTGAKGTARQTR